MKESLHLKLEKLLERQEELEGLLSDPEIISNQNKFRVLSQEYAEIRPIMICFNQYLKITKKTLLHKAKKPHKKNHLTNFNPTYN